MEGAESRERKQTPNPMAPSSVREKLHGYSQLKEAGSEAADAGGTPVLGGLIFTLVAR